MGTPASGRAGTRYQVPFEWFLRFRWGVAGCQGVVIGVAAALEPNLPAAALLGIAGLGAASNLVLGWLARDRARVSEALRGGVMVFDILLLTALLALAGAATNPFTALYVFYVALGALVLRPRWTWVLVGVGGACFGALFLIPAGHVHDADLAGHLMGMWLAFAVVAPSLAFAINRVQRVLDAADAELASARALQARSQQVASLATLAAGAAHEISSPLTTIAVIAKDLERHAAGNPRLEEDARLVRQEVDRCQHILWRLSADVGAGMGEAQQAVAVADLIEDALDDLPDRSGVDVLGDEDVLEATIEVPARLLSNVVQALVENALDASEAGVRVSVEVTRDEGSLVLAVRDRGTGMPAPLVARAIEPFFTTKEPGQGMGLGLFVAHSVVDQLGGRLWIDSTPGEGTTVSVALQWSGIGTPEERR